MDSFTPLIIMIIIVKCYYKTIWVVFKMFDKIIKISNFWKNTKEVSMSSIIIQNTIFAFL